MCSSENHVLINCREYTDSRLEEFLGEAPNKSITF